MNLVDWAQVISAVATSASVAAALWLARRSESQRLRFHTGLVRNISVGMEPRTAAEVLSTQIKLTIVNAGVLPAHVQAVTFLVRHDSSEGWGQLVNPDGQALLPLALQHGEQLSFTMSIARSKLPQGSMLYWWWWFRRARFNVWTTLGRRRVGLRWNEIKWFRRAILEETGLG